MGSRQVVSAIIEWAATALHDQPLLAIPTLVIAIGVLGLAIIEAATITVQVATVMIRHYHHRLSEFLEALRELRLAILPQKQAPLRAADSLHNESTRSRVIQKDRLAQQRLFDRTGDATNTRSESA